MRIILYPDLETGIYYKGKIYGGGDTVEIDDTDLPAFDGKYRQETLAIDPISSRTVSENAPDHPGAPLAPDPDPIPAPTLAKAKKSTGRR